MKLCIITANLGDFDKPFSVSRNQGVDFTFKSVTDADFPPRYNSMSPRLQARIVKTHMWDFAEGDYYLWVDSSCMLPAGAGKWFLEQLGDSDIAVFRHNRRKTIQEEADYLKHRLSIGCPYVTPRYANEDIDGQLSVVDPEAQLFASTAFIYRDSTSVRLAMKEWFYQIARYHSIDQLSLPEAIRYLNVKVIDADYLKVPQLIYTRNQ